MIKDLIKRINDKMIKDLIKRINDKDVFDYDSVCNLLTHDFVFIEKYLDIDNYLRSYANVYQCKKCHTKIHLSSFLGDVIVTKCENKNNGFNPIYPTCDEIIMKMALE